MPPTRRYTWPSRLLLLRLAQEDAEVEAEVAQQGIRQEALLAPRPAAESPGRGQVLGGTRLGVGGIVVVFVMVQVVEAIQRLGAAEQGAS